MGMLHNLLDATTERRMKLLETMIFYDHWISSSSLAKICRTSARTINNDLQYLKMNYPEYFTIETSKQHGVRLTPTTYFRLEVFYRHLMNETSIFQLIEGLFFHPEYSTQQWQDHLFLSSSSFYRLMKRIEIALKDYHIEFHHGFTGKNEVTLRYFFSNFFTEKYSYFDWPFDFDRQKVIQYVEDFVKYIQKNYFNNDDYYNLDSSQYLHLAMLVGTSLVRIKEKRYVTFSSQSLKFDWKQLADHFYEQQKDVAQGFIQELTLDEYYDLVYTLFAFMMTWDSQKEYTMIDESITAFILNFARQIDIPISTTELNRLRYTMLNQYASYKIYPYDHQMLFNQARFIGQLIHEIYPSLFETLINDLDELSAKTNFPWMKDLSEIIFWFIVKWPNLTKLLRQKHQKVRALVISDLGMDHQKYLMDIVEHIFSDFMEAHSYTDNVFDLENQLEKLDDDYDLIIISFDHAEKELHHANILNVNPILNDTDFKNIADVLQRIRQNRHLGVAELHRSRLQ